MKLRLAIEIIKHRERMKNRQSRHYERKAMIGEIRTKCILSREEINALKKKSGEKYTSRALIKAINFCLKELPKEIIEIEKKSSIHSYAKSIIFENGYVGFYCPSCNEEIPFALNDKSINIVQSCEKCNLIINVNDLLSNKIYMWRY